MLLGSLIEIDTLLELPLDPAAEFDVPRDAQLPLRLPGVPQR